MLTWHPREIQTEQGPRWVVESDAGDLQHFGHQYHDRNLAECWVLILNAYHKAWAEEKEEKEKNNADT